MLTRRELLESAGVGFPEPPCHPLFQELYTYNTNPYYRGFRDGYEGVETSLAGLDKEDEKRYVRGLIEGADLRMEMD